MATKLRRAEATWRIYEILAQDVPADVLLSVGPPREPVQTRAIVIEGARGELQVAHMRAGRKSYDDRFDIQVRCLALDEGADTYRVLDSTCQELAEFVHDMIADRPNLEVVIDGDGLDGVVAAVVSDLNGPERWLGTEGIGEQYQVTISVHVRME